MKTRFVLLALSSLLLPMMLSAEDEPSSSTKDIITTLWGQSRRSMPNR